MPPKTTRRNRRLRLALLALFAAVAGAHLTSVRADTFPGSVVQVGPWRLSAQALNKNPNFGGYTISRVQREGFNLFITLAVGGARGLFCEAPAWDLKPTEVYPTSFTVGSSPFTFMGHAINARAMMFKAAPEFFTELKSGLQLSVSANQRHFTMGLDGIETAMARQKDCVIEYAGTSTATQAPSAKDAYLRQVIQKMSQHLPDLHDANEGGTVALRFVIARAGRLMDASILRSSGVAALDRGLLESLKAASPYPPLPATIPDNQVVFTQSFAAKR